MKRYLKYIQLYSKGVKTLHIILQSKEIQKQMSFPPIGLLGFQSHFVFLGTQMTCSNTQTKK